MRVRFFILFVSSCIFIACNKNNKINNLTSKNNDVVEIKYEDGKNEVVESRTKKSTFETELEQAMKNFIPAIELVNEYKFEPITDYDLKLVDFYQNDDNCIICTYNNKYLCTITDISERVERIYNNCIPFRDDRLFSSSFSTKLQDKYYYGVINLSKGILKLYKSLQTDYQFSIPYYSGNGSFFIINNVRIIKPAFYDYKSFNNVDATYGGYIEVYNFFTNDLVYKIDKKELHENTKYDIDKIQYQEDGFRVVIGNCFDSDEYTDFKIFIKDNSFYYEIFDKYSYSDNVYEDFNEN